MAHIAKYKAASCGHMLAHYRRDAASLERDNVEPSLTHLNRTLVLGSDCHAHDGDVEKKGAARTTPFFSTTPLR